MAGPGSSGGSSMSVPVLGSLCGGNVGSFTLGFQKWLQLPARGWSLCCASQQPPLGLKGQKLVLTALQL